MSSGSGGSRSSQPGTTSDTQQDRSFPIVWSHVPSIKIVRQPKGRFSPQVDERCFTYCSQTTRGRTEQREPWCRTMCLRHVFAHEVTRLISAHDGQKAAAQTKFPLPPEGQRTPGLVDVLIGETQHDQSGSADKGEVRHWDEGYYLWLSKSRWATQEKLDLMRNDLERQAMWQRYKQQLNEKWEQQERRGGQKGSQPPGDAEDRVPVPSQPQQETARQREPVMLKRPFPDLSGESILLPIPPPFPPIQDQIRNLLAPTNKLLSLTHESIHTGSQWRFAQRIWEKAWTDEPLTLARNVCTRMWDKWKKGPPDDSE